MEFDYFDATIRLLAPERLEQSRISPRWPITLNNKDTCRPDRVAPIGDAHKGYVKGHLDFELQGEKLGGRWHLVKMHAKPREKHDNWLLIKDDDEFARPEGAPDILDERPESAIH